MDDLLIKYVNNAKDARLNFEMASYYNDIKHYAGACSYYLRCAEWANLPEETDIAYESLLHIAVCFNALGNRQWTEEGWLLHAISFQPQRPEAYWLISMLYERQTKWQESYTMACLGIINSSGGKQLLADIGYKGEYVIMFQKMIASWHIYRIKECRHILFNMPDWYNMDEFYVQLVQNNMNMVGTSVEPMYYFSPNDYGRLKIKFSGYDKIERNFSGQYQDMFVLSMLNGQRDLFYLEIGSGDPFLGNNTYLLESQFGWKGISVEIKESEVKKFIANRKNPCLCRDSLTINYEKLLAGMEAPKTIGYLQVDCEPPEITYKALLAIPLDIYKFAVITFEHDYHADASRKYKNLSRQYLEKHGYVLMIKNLRFNGKYDWEDWWVHPDLVDSKIIARMQNLTDENVSTKDYLFTEEEPEELFDWGNFPYSKQIEEEIFDANIYEKFFEVKEGDVVVDIGASVGPFTHAVLKKNPQKVYCVEPNIDFYNTLVKNVSSENVICLNNAIADTVYTSAFSDIHEYVRTNNGISFYTFIKLNEIEHIDFLKLDCEGGEYSVFTDENINYLLYRTSKIAAEFHLRYPDGRENFKNFRNKYLPLFKNTKIISCEHQTIKPGECIDLMPYVFDDEWVDNYDCEFMVYIDNGSFEWGEEYYNFESFRYDVNAEVFDRDVYQKFFKVEEGDVVVDIGASTGPFSYKIMRNNPAKVVCIEPCEKLIPTLRRNVPNAICINAAMTDTDDKTNIAFMFTENNDGTRFANGLKFSTFIKEYGVEKIDFLKIDCEGGEYSVFNDENFDWITKHVKKISGEFHLNTWEQKTKFKAFRDTYLKHFKNVEIYSYDDVDIKSGLWHDNFLCYWGFFNVYIDNR